MAASAQPSPCNASRLLRRAERARTEGELQKAERLYQAVLAREPQNFDALHGLGQIHYARGRFDTALALFQTALKADLTRAEGFSSLGLVFHALKQFARALTSYDEGLRLVPDDAELLNRRGVALLELGRIAEALQDFERALAADPQHFDALGNRGNALFRLNRPVEAIESYDRTLTRDPDNAALLTNRAIALRRLDRPREALMSAARALATQPDFAPARFVDGTVRLALGDFAAGWRGYEARWGGALARERRKLAVPLWLGDAPLGGRTILLHAEQGFGDTIQFVRYAPLVAARGARVVLEVQPQLVRLFSNLRGIDSLLARKSSLPPFDCHCPLASLPLAFATALETIPADIPYIAPDARKVADWRARFAAWRGQGRPLIGLAWAGERSHDNDINRSIRLETLLPLLDMPDVQFVSLQHQVRDDDAVLLQSRADVLHVGGEFADFSDTAAAIAALDAVVCVDTAIAHLAGAMGKPLLLLLPYAADFRWLRERTDSPWYPTARLYRQLRFADWDRAVANVAEELARFREWGLPQRGAVAGDAAIEKRQRSA
jgi:tetratricopeptide (TPR) repeat protein